MHTLARAVILGSFLASTLSGCASHRLLSDDQADLIRSHTKSIRSALPGIHAAIAASSFSGALVVLEKDGSVSEPYLADSAEAAAAQRLNERAKPEDGYLTACFVYGTSIARSPTWHVLRELEVKAIEKRTLQTTIQSLRESVSTLSVEVTQSADSIAKVSAQVSQLESFGIELTRLGLVHQAMLDGFQEQLTALRKTAANLQEAATASAKTVSDTQALVRDSLKLLSDRLAAIEAQVKTL